MGNEIGSYKNCKLTEVHEISSAPYAVYSGLGPDDADVSVFVYNTDEVDTDLIQNSVKHLKTLKHPGIVSLRGVDSSHDETWVVTEHVFPLEAAVETLSSEEILAGLYDVTQVMTFIHDRARVCHNNLGIASIFVSDGGAWKIAGFEAARPFDKVTSSDLAQVAKWRPKQAIAPEENSGFKASIELGHARDCYAFGHVATQLLGYCNTSGEASMDQFVACLQERCLNTDPRHRPSFSALLTQPVFKNAFVTILNFLRQLSVKSDVERGAFFLSLASRLFQLPPNLVARRLSRPLLARFVLLEAAAVEHLLPHLLTPCRESKRPETFRPGEVNPLLPAPLFQKFLIPEIVKIFHVHDAHIRIILLRHFHAYHSLFNVSVLKAVVLPQVLLGLRDSNDELCALSLRALADLVPILGGNAVISHRRGRIFTSGMPKKIESKAMSLNGVSLHKLASIQKPQASLHQSSNSSPSIATAVANDNTAVANVVAKDPAKEAERERRREEARRRAEERRQRREERRKNPIQAQLVEEDDPPVKTIESDDGGPADLNKLKSDLSTTDHHGDKLNQSEESSEISATSPKHDIPEKQDSSFDRTESDDYEMDMDGNELNNSTDNQNSFISEKDPTKDCTESDIDQEIEAELQSMVSTVSLNKQPTFPPEPDVHVDWSDATSRDTLFTNKSPAKSSSARGVLKLKAPSKVKSSTETEKTLDSKLNNDTNKEETKSVAFEDWSQDSWGDIEPQPIISPRQNSSPRNNSTEAGSQPTSPLVSDTKFPALKTSQEKQRTGHSKPTHGPPKISDSLGAEFDIKNIDSKRFKMTSSQEVDFFADMIPSLYTTKPANVLDMLSTSADKSHDKEQPAGKSALSFAVQDSAQSQDTGGWENEDFEW